MLKEILSKGGLKDLTPEELRLICEEIRDTICQTVNNNGGHLASNLGAVELTVALHYVFDLPNDKLIFDVGHQSYTHKILSGRLDKIHTLRQEGGLSGFPKREESDYDAFNTGHASTAFSAALGFAKARDLLGQNHEVIAVIGDGAFGGGMVYEALNNLQTINSKVIIILNDNQMSIDKSVGGFYKHLSKLRISLKYTKLKRRTKLFIKKIPLIGKPLCLLLEKIKRFISLLIFKKAPFFEHFGLKYVGAVDGNDLKDLIKTLKKVRDTDQSVLLHLVTKKGKGSIACEQTPENFHGVKPNGDGKKAEYSKAAGDALCKLAETNEKITAVAAAMGKAVGLERFSQKYPGRFIDVGICESHAVTLAAGLAAAGLKPYFAVYSTFLQRGFDQVLHDVAISNLPVTFLIDRAGIVGDDGETHQGVFDLSYLSLMPNMTIACPKDMAELAGLINFSENFNAPLAIRYPRESEIPFGEIPLISDFKWQVLRQGKSNLAIIACGERMISAALSLGSQITVINARFIKPLDYEMLLKYKDKALIVLEDNAKAGGLGSQIGTFYSDRKIAADLSLCGYGDEFIPQGKIDSLIKKQALNRLFEIVKGYEA